MQQLAERAQPRHITTQALWAGSIEFAGIVVRYGWALLIARLTGAEGLGLFTLAVAFGSAAALAGRVGLDRASMRFTAYHRARGERALAAGVNIFATHVTLILSVAIGVLLFVAAEALERTWAQPGLADGVRVIAVAEPAIALGEVWRDGLRGFQDVRLASALEKIVIPGVASVTLVVLNVVEPGKPIAAVVGTAAAFWLAAAVAGLALRRDVRALGVARVISPRPWLGFAVFLSLEGGLLYLLQWTDQLLVGYLLTARDVGIYAAVVRMGLVVSVPLLATNTILGPTFAALYGARDYASLRVTYTRFTWIAGLGGLGLGVVLIALGVPALALFGSEFPAGYPALFVLVLGQVVNAATGSVGTLLGMTGHVRLRLLNAALTASVNVALNWLLIPMFGILGSAVATSAAIVVINLLQVVEVRLALGFWGYDPRELGYWFDRLRSLRRRAAAGVS